MVVRTLLLAPFFFCFTTTAQVIHPYRVCESPAALKEFSGLAQVDINKLAAVNDGGNSPTVYFLDTTGRLLKKRTFTTIKNTDWEELFYANGHLYIADVGDNQCRRKELKVYDYDLKKDTVVAVTPFNFAEKKPGHLKEKDLHYDCEAGFYAGGQLWFFSKTHAKPYTGKSVQYKITPGEKFTEHKGMDSVFLGNKGFIYNSITGAAISPSGDKVVFISCTHLWVRIAPQKGQYLNTGLLMDFDFDGLTQKESVTFMTENKLVVADERTFGLMGGRMYFFDLMPYLNGQKKYTRPQVQTALLKKRGNHCDFAFESLRPLEKVELIMVGTGGKILSRQFVALKENKVKTTLESKNDLRPIAFWVVAGNKILYTSKISNP